VWLGIQYPELLGTPVSDSLLEQVTEDVSTFHQVFCATMVMAGPGPLNAALAEKPAPAQLRAGIEDFAAALSATEADRPGEPYEDMYAALELVLGEDTDLDRAVRYLLSIAGLAARFTSTDANPRKTLKDHVPAPGMLTHYLLVKPALHAALTLHRHDLDDAVRTRMLSLAAEVGPVAAGDLAAEFPGLVASGISKHLMGLRGAGLVQATREGRQQIYALEAKAMQDALTPWLKKYDRFWQQALERLRDLAEEDETEE
jgi:DNA-binding transcriptional ArsR family regulator